VLKHLKPCLVLIFSRRLKSAGSEMTINRAGGEAYRTSAEYRLASLLMTNFVTDQYYRTASESLSELKTLINDVDPGLCAIDGRGSRKSKVLPFRRMGVLYTCCSKCAAK